jgi:hypothetical protein
MTVTVASNYLEYKINRNCNICARDTTCSRLHDPWNKGVEKQNVKKQHIFKNSSNDDDDDDDNHNNNNNCYGNEHNSYTDL